MNITSEQIKQSQEKQQKQIDGLSKPQRTNFDNLINNYDGLIKAYNGNYTELSDIKLDISIPICDLYTSFIAEFTTTEPKTEVEKLASEKVPLITEDSFIKTVNNYEYHEDVFPYNNYGKDLKWLLKRLLACYYKKNTNTNIWTIDWFDFKEQIAKDVHRNEGITFDNDNMALSTWNPRVNKEPREEDLLVDDYYKYICFQIINKNIQTTQFNQLDLINICTTIVAQTFKATWFADFSKPASGFGLTDGPYRPDRPDRYNLFSLLYGLKKNSTNYNITDNTITFDMYQNVVNLLNMNNYDNSGLGFRIINIKMILDLNKNDASLNLIYYQSFNLYRNGVYIGEMDTENNTLDADGKGIFYIDDYNSDTAKYPTAKVSGSFSKGILKAGTMVDIEFYSSEDDFNTKTYKDGLDKSNGVVSCLKNIKPGYIKIPADINLNAIDTEYLTNLVNIYNTYQAKLTAVTAERQMIGDIMEKINTLNYLKFSNTKFTDSRLLKEGTIWFQPDANGRQYFYVGPIQIDNTNSNILYVSKYGTINQLSNGKSKSYIRSGELKRQNWYEFVLKPQITLSNYKTLANLPLQWTKYNIDLGFDMLDRTAVKGFFTKEMLETIGKTHNIDNAVFSDKIRLQKILEKIYIEAIIYLSAFNIVLKKYKTLETDVKMLSALENINNIISSTINNTNSDYNSFINFNDKISNIYLTQTNNNENTLTNYSQQIILPILASLRPETSNLFKSINIDINSESKENIEKLLIILTKNIILILYLFTMITANLGDDTNKVLPNYDPLVVTPIFNLFKDTYNNIVSNTDPSINPETRLAIEKNADSIISMNTNQMLSLLLMMAMLFDKQTYSGKTSTNKTGGSKIIKNKTQRKTKHYKKWKTRNKNRANKANKTNKGYSKMYTRKYKKPKSRRYSSKK
jgi:hypothetical protein